MDTASSTANCTSSPVETSYQGNTTSRTLDCGVSVRTLRGGCALDVVALCSGLQTTSFHVCTGNHSSYEPGPGIRYELPCYEHTQPSDGKAPVVSAKTESTCFYGTSPRVVELRTHLYQRPVLNG